MIFSCSRKNKSLFIIMRSLACLALVITLAFGASLPLPPRFPYTSVSATSYNIPASLGVFVNVAPSPSSWVLPLTYRNGGNVSIGQMIWIRNAGSGAVTFASTAPDTIDGGSSGTVNTGSSIQMIAGDAGVWYVLGTSVCLFMAVSDAPRHDAGLMGC